MAKSMSGSEIRQSFLEYFEKKHKHTIVPSASLVPAKDATLLFTNSGMVQFVDVFLGTGTRNYTRAVDSQKCLRVAGKHNDLEDVGTNDTHHTFFEMLGNWSFGDYYKKEAIAWAWELLTEVWKLPKERLYASVFRDEKGEIPTDEEAAKEWLAQDGFVPEHLAYLGRKFNFWEMADTGPCGPNSEIHIDLGEKYGELSYLEDGQIDLDGPRFVELWNLVFIQYNRKGKKQLDPLPSMHVDTGLGLERIVSVLQNTNSNYRTDLFQPIIDKIRSLAGHSKKEMDSNFTPYRVIADHCRAAAFLIADGVVPGNMGRNYVTRMIIRRAARFGSKIGLNEPFLAKVAEAVIEEYGNAYPELIKNADSIRDNLQREEERFQRTVEGGLAHLDELFKELEASKGKILDGAKAFGLHATFGLPLEITRDIAQERGLDVDDKGFKSAMEKHRKASGAGQAMSELGGKEAEIYREIFQELQKEKKLSKQGVLYDPYSGLKSEGEILALVQDGKKKASAKKGEHVAVLMPKSAFYVASGGQVSDSGMIRSANGKQWKIRVDEVPRPSANVIVHVGEVIEGSPKVGDKAIAEVDAKRRQDIIRNHTGTHLLHAALHKVVGEHARQAGSLVAPDRLRFDFNHNEALSQKELDEIEILVNKWILENHKLNIEYKNLAEAKKEGAIALFGEKYGEEVRTIQIGDNGPFSYELCGGTHVESTGEIGTFIIVSEGSAAAGIRRIEAITGRAAYELISERHSSLRKISKLLKTNIDYVVTPVISTLQDNKVHNTELKRLRNELAHKTDFSPIADFKLTDPEKNVSIYFEIKKNTDDNQLLSIIDIAKKKITAEYFMFIVVSEINKQPKSRIWVSPKLSKKGFDAGKIAKSIGNYFGGGGGGSKTMGQTGGGEIKNLEKFNSESFTKLLEKNYNVVIEPKS